MLSLGRMGSAPRPPSRAALPENNERQAIMISLIAIPGRGYYTILVDAEGQHPPALQLVTDRHLISEAKDLYMVAPF